MPSAAPAARTCAILAGGAGSRLEGRKATFPLAGRPLAQHVVDAARAAGLEPLLVAKPDTDLRGITAAILREPVEPLHPLSGIVAALTHTGAPIVCCPCDVPLIPAQLLRGLARRSGSGTVVLAAGRVHPLLGYFDPSLGPRLETAAREGEPATSAVVEAGAQPLDLLDLAPDADPTLAIANVNDQEDAKRVGAYLAGSASGSEPGLPGG